MKGLVGIDRVVSGREVANFRTFTDPGMPQVRRNNIKLQDLKSTTTKKTRILTIQRTFHENIFSLIRLITKKHREIIFVVE